LVDNYVDLDLRPPTVAPSPHRREASVVNRHSCFIWLLLLGLAGRAYGLEPRKLVSQYIHDSWQNDEGLPQNSVRAIARTPDGFLWLASQEGLIRFDGLTFKAFDVEHVPELRTNLLHALLVSHDGSLWIGSWGGVSRLKDHRFHHVKELESDHVLTLAEGAGGAIWIGTDGAGLKRLDASGVRSFTTHEGLPNNSVAAVLEDSHGTVWVGTRGGGLCQLVNDRCTVFGPKDGLPSDHVHVLHEDPSGTLWVGTRKGLCRREGDHFVPDGPTQNVISLRTDSHRNLWIGTYGSGLARKTAHGVSFYSSAQGLTNDIVGAIHEDPEGSLWIGTESGGLNRLRDGRLTPYAAYEGLTASNVNPILQDRSGAIWIGAASEGLFRLEGNRITRYSTTDGLADRGVYSLFEDSEGTLWVGTKAGLNRFRNGKFTVFTTRNGLSSDFIFSILQARDGSLWLGTSGGGLNHWKDGEFSALTTHEGLANNNVLALHQDRGGALWIATAAGLSRLEVNGQLTTFSPKDGVPRTEILSFYEDSDGTLWIGTAGAGLLRWKDNRFAIITTKQGLFNDVSYRILEDRAGNLWISCNKGIYRVNKRELDEVASGRVTRVHSTAFGREDGMPATECNWGFPGGWVAQDGRLWFPTVKGAVVVDPANLPTNEVPPPVVIDRVLVDDVEVDPTRPVTLQPGARKLVLHFAGLSFVNPKRVLFRHQLEGFDSTWEMPTTERTATYTSLAHGTYRFRVIASNSDGRWNEQGASLTVVQQPYIYQTPWFLGLITLVGGLVVIAGYRFRVRLIQRTYAREKERLNELNRALEGQVAERTKSLE
jgi:ligand-binding sensor domain-containing protein